MASVAVVWKGSCRDPQTRYRLLGYLHRLATRSDEYLRLGQPERPAILSMLSAQRGENLPARANIELIDQPIAAQILVSSCVSPDPQALIESARAAGLLIVEDAEGEGPILIAIEDCHLRGTNFKLFDPRGLYPGDDRMSFLFLECPKYHFLDGRLVEIATAENGPVSEVLRAGKLYLHSPGIQLRYYLEDWTDCLFSWLKFFFIGDFWWHRWEQMQGYSDYRGVFEEVQAERGREAAEEATFDAMLATFCQHAEHWIGEVQGWAKAEKEHS
jgi:hypothetical protein